VAAREIFIEVHRVLLEAMVDRGVNLEDVFDTPETARALFDSLPSFDVAVTIKTAYHRDPNHTWTMNDIHDIDAMGSALPYCDIVVTDKALVSQVARTGLAERLGTTVLRNIGQLPEHF
jgi:hypothetical protein